MDEIDARKLSPNALKPLRSQAMRLRQKLGLPWREIARVMGLNTTTVFGCGARQGRCRLFHAVSRCLLQFNWLPSIAASRSGLSVAVSTGCQLRVYRRQRDGASLASKL